MTPRIPIWFDIDGTLLHTTAGHDAFRIALEEVFGWTDSLESVVFAGNTDLRVLHDMAERHGRGEWDCIGRAAAFFERMALHMHAGLHRLGAEIVPGALDLLHTLRADDRVVLGLLTGNARACAEAKLRHVGVDPSHFHHGGFGDMHPDRNELARRARDSACAFLAPGEQLGAGWVIGDTLRDLAAARAIGARCLGIVSGATTRAEFRAHGADRIVDSLHPTPELLGWLLDSCPAS